MAGCKGKVGEGEVLQLMFFVLYHVLVWKPEAEKASLFCLRNQFWACPIADTVMST